MDSRQKIAGMTNCRITSTPTPHRSLGCGRQPALCFAKELCCYFAASQLGAHRHVRAAQAGEQPVFVIEIEIPSQLRKILRVAQILGREIGDDVARQA